MASQRQLLLGILHTFLLVSSVYSVISDCETPDGKEGKCMSEDDVNYFKRSLCGWQSRTPMACCPLKYQRQRAHRHLNIPVGSSFKESLLPKKCGMNDNEDRIIGGNMARLGQFPWMALIEYKTLHGFKATACGGSLISSRYVVTAGHCVRGSILADVGNPVGVRLGEHDIRNKGKDCEMTATGPDCADEPVVIPIERYIVHPQYSTAFYDNDIALIRMERSVIFTSFIQPICLPSSDRVGAKLHTAGWGLTSNGKGAKGSSVKMVVQLPHVELKACKMAYESYELSSSQMCAGGVRGKDTCRGDSGGPLMNLVGIRYYMVGITSFGPRYCATAGIPGVYTKTYAYLNWIKSNLEP